MDDSEKGRALRVAAKIMVFVAVDEKRAFAWAVELMNRGFAPEHIEDAAKTSGGDRYRDLVETLERGAQRRRRDQVQSAFERSLEEAMRKPRRQLTTFAAGGLQAVPVIARELYREIAAGKLPASRFDDELERRRDASKRGGSDG